MSNVIYGQYDSNNYPLKKFYENELPDGIREILFELSQKKLAVFRGGLAFVFLLNEKNYLLKDLDMIAYAERSNEIIGYLREADIVYINKNTFGDTVITAFWKTSDEYFKLDILLCTEMPSVCEKNIDGKQCYVVTASYVWRNRIEKIAEKEIRMHDDKKTLNHFNVVKKLSQYLQENNDDIHAEDCIVVKEKLPEVQAVLSKLILNAELEQFMMQQLELVRG
jgi:hypothetical protein